MKAKVFLLSFVIAGIICTPLFADVVHTKDGRHLEGEIVEETEEYVKLKMKFGTITVDKSKIEKIERGGSKEEEFKKRFAEVNKRDVKALFKLTDWCKDQHLPKGREQVLKAILKADPSNARAGKALGYKLGPDGCWHEPGKRSAVEKTDTPQKPPEESESEQAAEKRKTEEERAKAIAEIFKDKSNKELVDTVNAIVKDRRWREAITVFNELYRRGVGKQNPTFGYNLAKAYREIGEAKLAIQTCEDNLPFTKLKSDYKRFSPALKVLISSCHCRLGNYKQAVKFGEEAITEDPSMSTNYYHLGKVYLYAGYPKKAEEIARKGIEVKADQFNRLLLATALALQGDKTSARKIVSSTAEQITEEYRAMSSMDIARGFAACGDADKAARYINMYLTEYVTSQKRRNEIKREIAKDPGFRPVVRNRNFVKAIKIADHLDDSKWEFGVVKDAGAKSADELKKLKTGRKEKKGQGQLPPELDPKEWIIIRTRNYDMLTNSLPERLEELAYRLEAMMLKYRELFGAKKLKLERFTVKMFKAKSEFQNYVRKKKLSLEHAAAYHSPGDKELVCYDRFLEGKGHEIYSILYHEACHQFAYAFFNGPQPMWLSEGFACYFETAEYKYGKITKVGTMNYDRSKRLITAIREGGYVPLEKFLPMGRAAFYDKDKNVSLIHYAEGWHLVYYLLNKSSATKKMFSNYLKIFRETRDAAKAQKDTFEKFGLDRLEKDFKNYVLKGK